VLAGEKAHGRRGDSGPAYAIGHPSDRQWRQAPAAGRRPGEHVAGERGHGRKRASESGPDARPRPAPPVPGERAGRTAGRNGPRGLRRVAGKGAGDP
jgi:hypothetical protein